MSCLPSDYVESADEGCPWKRRWEWLCNSMVGINIKARTTTLLFSSCPLSSFCPSLQLSFPQITVAQALDGDSIRTMQKSLLFSALLGIASVAQSTSSPPHLHLFFSLHRAPQLTKERSRAHRPLQPLPGVRIHPSTARFPGAPDLFRESSQLRRDYLPWLGEIERAECSDHWRGLWGECLFAR